MISRTRMAILASILVAVIAAAAPHDSVVSEVPECEVAIAWVDANLENLPRDYDEFSSFSRVYRKAIYAKLPSEAQLALWRDHIEAFVAEHDLTDRQLQMIAEVESQFEEFFRLGASDEVREAATLTRAVLGRDLAYEAFFDLGGLGEEANLAVQADGEACSCNLELDDCPNGYACTEDGDGCDVIDDNCGFMGFFDCDGECYSP